MRVAADVRFLGHVDHSSGCFSEFLELTVTVVIGQFSWSMEDGQGAIDVLVDTDPDADIMAAITVCRDLVSIGIEN